MLHPMKYLHPKNMSYFAPFWATPHPWAMLHTAELYVAPYQATMRSFFSYAAPSELHSTLWATLPLPHWAALHSIEQRCTLMDTLLSLTAPCWATFHPDELPHLHTALCWTIQPAPSTLLSYAAPFWTMLNLMSNAEPYWATGRSTELCCTLLNYVAPTELHWI